MKRFIYKLIYFVSPLLVFFSIGLLMPPTPRASTSLLFATKKKDELLLYTKNPRMIFIGGSNLSFGLNSKMIKDELNINPINTGVHAFIGSRYMLISTLPYIREDDIVVLALEYDHFYRDYNATSEELLRTILDVDSSRVKFLNLQQLVGLIPYIPKYSISKFKFSEYSNFQESDIYSANSFNEYGDANAHWGKKKKEFQPHPSIDGYFNKEVIHSILEFNSALKQRKARLFVTYPGFQVSSYLNSSVQIDRVANEYMNNGLSILGYPKRYKMPNHMMFDTPYHLNKEGVDYRTRLFIDDYKKAILQTNTSESSHP